MSNLERYGLLYWISQFKTMEEDRDAIAKELRELKDKSTGMRMVKRTLQDPWDDAVWWEGQWRARGEQIARQAKEICALKYERDQQEMRELKAKGNEDDDAVAHALSSAHWHKLWKARGDLLDRKCKERDVAIEQCERLAAERDGIRKVVDILMDYIKVEYNL